MSLIEATEPDAETEATVERSLLEAVAGGRVEPRALILAMRPTYGESIVRRAMMHLLRSGKLALDPDMHLRSA